jgi:hypothetical protein
MSPRWLNLGMQDRLKDYGLFRTQQMSRAIFARGRSRFKVTITIGCKVPGPAVASTRRLKQAHKSNTGCLPEIGKAEEAGALPGAFSIPKGWKARPAWL